MKLSTNQLKALSDERRGIKAKTFKLPIAFIAEIEQLSTQLNIPQNQLIIQAVELFKQSQKRA
ncbi:ribbon-helix-helix protein, CopG family [[Pasteurella] aerogenes]